MLDELTLSLDDMMNVFSSHSGLEFEVVQLAPGHLGYRETSVALGDVTISLERADKPLRMQLCTGPGVVTVSFMLAGSGSAFWCGHEIETAHALVFADGENDYILPSEMCSLNITAPVEAYRRLGLPQLRSGLWRTVEVPRRQLMSTCCAALAGQRFPPDTDVGVLAAVCDALNIEPGSFQFAGAGPSDPTRQFRLLQRAEQMEPEALTNLDAIAGALCTSQRSLQRAFKDLAGLGPQSYLRIVRLHQFRQQLILSAPDETITGLAHDHGFENMGRLSSQYRDWFGELPRDTRKLRQAG